MNKRRLTFKRVFNAHTYRYSEPTITARFDSYGEGETNQIIVETEQTVWEDMNARCFVRNGENHFLVGEVVNRLYEYEQLGYSPDELKGIIDDRKKLEEKLNSIYGVGAFDGNVEMLYPRVFIESIGRRNGKTLMQAEMLKEVINERVDRRKNILAIKDVIFNDPATIIFWKDGTKTVVKAEGEDFDPEKGLAMAISKKALGNQRGYYDVFKKWLKKYNPYSRTLVFNVGDAARENKQNAIKALKGALKHTRVTKEMMRCAMEEAIRYLEKEN